MPMISDRHDGRSLLLDVVVLPHQPSSSQSTSDFTQPVLSMHSCRALIDTGSVVTCITDNIIAALSLRPYGLKQMGNVYSIANHKTFLVKLGFPVQDNGQQRHGLHILPKTVVAPQIRSMDHFDVLIGMDVIGLGDLNVMQTGRFSFAFEAA
jgi:hypothetical protein